VLLEVCRRPFTGGEPLIVERTVLVEMQRVLKPGRWLSLCYHDTDPKIWTTLQDAIEDCGLVIESVCALEPKSKSRNAITAEIVVKSDLVINCRKPSLNGGKVDGSGSEIGQVSRRVRGILIETLGHLGGQTRDRLWDILLKRLLTRGQMAEHRFEDILAEVATRAESGRWYLKEEFERLSQNDIRNEEAAGDALVRFGKLRCSGVPVNFASHIALSAAQLAKVEIDETEVEEYIKARLIEDPALKKKFELGGRMKGVEFYDCLFFYLTRFLKGRPGGQTPRRNLAEFLDEYLVRFKEADKWLYRAPDAAEAESLRKSRHTGLGRRIRQYIAFLSGEGDLPSERRPGAKTIVAWLKHCAAFGLAAEGVLLFEKGGLVGQLGQLSEDDRYDAEDYYAQCRRKAGKAANEQEDDADLFDGDEEEDEE
jgi:hypothetical protein